jgi:hypothetical protein
VKGDVSGRYEVFGEQGFVAGAIDLKDFATALVGDEVAVVDGVIGRCVGNRAGGKLGRSGVSA